MTSPMPAMLDEDERTPSLKINIVVHGRFHGLALGKALLGLGHDVTILTNYPGFIVERFGVPRRHVRSFVAHAIVARAGNRLSRYLRQERTDPILHQMFGRWAARNVNVDADIVYGFSGVMEEFLRMPRRHAQQLRLVVRGSAHIREQDRILREEEARVGAKLDRASDWMIEREEREYALADRVVVLSSFARDSFVRRGFDASRLLLLPLGVNVDQFRPTPDAQAARQQRILSGKALRVLNVGTFSYQKGMQDLVDTARVLAGRLEFRFVGSKPKETMRLQQQAQGIIEMIDRVPEAELRTHYEWADLFFFTTLQDGFAAVLRQAAAAGLPILATTNCGAPDFVEEGRTGFILPIRDRTGFIDRLNWCDTNREQLAAMADAASREEYVRDWREKAQELVALYRTKAIAEVGRRDR